MRLSDYNLTTITGQWKEFTFAKSVIETELTGIFGTETRRDLSEILALYSIYESGADFDIDITHSDYVAANHRFKIIRSIIDKEARFLFSHPPKITLEDASETAKDENGKPINRLEANELLLEKVLQSNHFNSKLVRAAKDCLVGRRIAIAVDFNDSGVDISFMPSLEFIYETDPTDVDVITKFIRFYSIQEHDESEQQRIYKKTWEMVNGKCFITEGVYDGNAHLIPDTYTETKTELDSIPCWVIINGGLVGDPFGKSDVEELVDDESWYSKLSSKDFDSLRKGTDQIVWAMDVNPDSTKNLSRAAGSFWDLSSAPTFDGSVGKVGVLENNMSYADALDTTLNRIRSNMFSQLDVPDTTSDALQGIVTSGKTMEAIYWGLMVRCDEKLLDWKPAIQNMVECIIEGCKIFPNAKAVYTDMELVDDYLINIENTYPILRDESEEKSTNILEVNANVMSRKAYMKKWRNLSDEDVEDELAQIKREQELLDRDTQFTGALDE